MAVDILTGEEVIISTGPVKEAVLSSISIAGVFPPRRIDGRLLLDGGPVNQVPVNVAINMGADFVIAVDLAFMAKKRDRYRNVFKKQTQYANNRFDDHITEYQTEKEGDSSPIGVHSPVTKQQTLKNPAHKNREPQRRKRPPTGDDVSHRVQWPPEKTCSQHQQSYRKKKSAQ